MCCYLNVKNKINHETAGDMFGAPYLISAIFAPILGYMIDRKGKRVMFIIISSLILIVAFTISLFLPDTEGSKLELIPLVLLGFGYSIYCSAIWGSIPYVVEPHTIGTAFGLCTAIQNIGLTVSPLIVG